MENYEGFPLTAVSTLSGLVATRVMDGVCSLATRYGRYLFNQNKVRLMLWILEYWKKEETVGG